MSFKKVCAFKSSVLLHYHNEIFMSILFRKRFLFFLHTNFGWIILGFKNQKISSQQADSFNQFTLFFGSKFGAF